jgi:hypothetical protein
MSVKLGPLFEESILEMTIVVDGSGLEIFTKAGKGPLGGRGARAVMRIFLRHKLKRPGQGRIVRADREESCGNVPR